MLGKRKELKKKSCKITSTKMGYSKFIIYSIKVLIRVTPFQFYMRIIGVRKLSGRLICELTFNSEQNQNIFTEMFSFSAINGKVCLN